MRADALGLLCAGAVGLAVAGCGSATGASKRDFVTQADKACLDGNLAVGPLARKLASAQRGTDPATVYDEVASLTRRAAAAAQPYLDRLDTLQAPAADADRIATWIADTRHQQALLTQLADAYDARDQRAITALSERIDALNARNNAFARGYGMLQCAKNAA